MFAISIGEQRESLRTTSDMLGLLFGTVAVFLVWLIVGAGMGSVLAVVLFGPFFFLFRWLSAPLALDSHNSEKQGSTKMQTKEKRQYVLTLKDSEEAFGKCAYVEGDEWVCICGVHNLLDWDMKVQNCIRCFRSRDYVLTTYPRPGDDWSSLVGNH